MRSRDTSLEYSWTFCASCVDYTVHYKQKVGVEHCIRCDPQNHDLGEFLDRKLGYNTLKVVREAGRMMERAVSSS